MTEMAAFTDELLKIAKDKQEKESFKEEAARVAKNIIFKHAPGFGLGTALGWAAGKKIIPKIAPSIAKNPALLFGVTVGTGLLGAHLNNKLTKMVFDAPQKRNSR